MSSALETSLHTALGGKQSSKCPKLVKKDAIQRVFLDFFMDTIGDFDAFLLEEKGRPPPRTR